jgi:HPt (histidine-containing phosphotransfer) domain-containing protein
MNSTPMRKNPLDVQAALATLDQDEDLLAVVMQGFMESFQTSSLALDQAVAQGQFESAAELVHPIKGLAPNVGDRDLHEAFTQELQAVLAAIEAWAQQRPSA